MKKTGLDLSKFKKSSENSHTVTLHHDDGHTLVVAKKSLKDDLRKQLSSLPTHKKAKKMAEGGMAEYDSGTETGQEEPEAAPPPTGTTTPIVPDMAELMRGPLGQSAEEASGAMGQPYSERATGTAPEPAPTPALADMDTSSPAPAPAAPAPAAPNPYAQLATAQAPSDGTGGGPVPAPTAPPAPTPQDTAQYLKNENAAFNYDVTAGHITPQTMDSMFAKQDTLGKIGTLFGLLLSGAGSGLSKQPNAVLALMQKEIDNDFAAQVQSKSNQMNLMKLNQEHEYQRAQMNQMQYQNAESQARVGNIASEIESRKHQNALTDAQVRAAGIQAQAAARMQANSLALHSLVQSVAKMDPASAEYAQAQQMLGMLSQSVQNENYSIADRAAAGIAMSNMALGTGNIGGDDAKFERQQQMLLMSGQKERAEADRKQYIPGVGKALVDVTPQDREAIRANQDMIKAATDYRDFVKANSGTTLDRAKVNEGKTKAKELQSAYRVARKFGTPTGSEQEFIEGIIPTDPTQFMANVRTLPKIDAVITRTQQNLDGHLKSLGIQPAAQPEQIQVMNGVKHRKVQGGWAPIK